MRCKRCGSIINYEDEICKGCGRSLIDLKGANEIEFDDNATINVEPIKKDETPKLVEEEKKIEDIFGDAIYGSSEQINENSKEQLIEHIHQQTNNVIEPLNNLSTNSNTVPSEPVGINNVETNNIDNALNETVNAEPINDSNEVVNTEPNTTLNETVSPINPVVNPMVNESVNTTNNVEVTKPNVETLYANKPTEEEFIPKKKSKAPLLILVIILLALAGVATYFYMKTEPKNVFKSSIKKLFSISNKVESTLSNSQVETYMKFNIENSGEENPIYALLNNVSFSLKAQVDDTNKNLMFNISSTYNGEEIINSTIYGTKNTLYGLLNNVFDKYISFSIDSKEYDALFDRSAASDVKVILNELEKEVYNSLDTKYFKRSNDGMNNVSTLVLNKQNYVEFNKTLLNNIKSNSKLIDALAKISSEDTTTIKSEIDSEIANVQIEEEFNINIKMTSNILDGKVKKIEILNGKGNSITIDVTSNDLYNIEIKTNDIITKASLTITTNNGFKEYKFTVEDSEVGKVSYILGYKQVENTSLVLPDLSNSVDYKEITEEDMAIIEQNLLNNPLLSGIVQGILSINNEDIYNENYDFENENYDFEDENYDFEDEWPIE